MKTTPILLILAGALLLAAPAGAAAPEQLFQAPADSVLPGEGAGQMNNPRGIATDPASGHFYVSEYANKRIDEFTPWGVFVKAWGWGVIASGPGNLPQDEIQEVAVDATGGSFALRFFNALHKCSTHEDTAQIPFNASAGALQAALEALCGLAPGDAIASGPSGGPWTIEFSASHADTDVLPLQPIVLDSKGDPTLSGGSASATVKTIQGGANFEVCVPAQGDVCRAGQGVSASGAVGGASPGQFTGPFGITVDAAGDIYVFDRAEGNLRVQKFDPEGHFLAMFGGEVDKTTKANVCTKADLQGGDECGVGVSGTAPGQFSTGSVGNFIAYDAKSDSIFIGDKGRIQELGTDGSFKGEIDFEGGLEAFAGKSVDALAADPLSGDLYATFIGSPDVYRLDRATGAVLDVLEVPLPPSNSTQRSALATDAAGSLYAVYDPPKDGTDESEPRVLAFDAAGNAIVTAAEGLAAPPTFFSAFDQRLINGLATGSICGGGVDLYASYFLSGSASYLKAFGTPPIACEEPPAAPPEVKSQFATSVDADAATLGAQVNPRFWPDATYYLEYGTGKCSEGGCGSQALAPGAKLTSKSTNSLVNTAGVFLSGLQPGTTYHYRFVAQSSGGGPVYGALPKGGGEASFEAGVERTFRTFATPTAPKACPANQQFRSGPSALLPDCRAYEMVSPLDKNNADIIAANNISKRATGLFQSAASGERMTYSTIRAFADPQSAPYTSQYLASRDPDAGWLTEAISPPRTKTVVSAANITNNQFKAFSSDLCMAWIRPDSDPPLAAGAVPGYANLYRREDCGAAAGGFEALSPAVPPHVAPAFYGSLELQGVSADGSHAIYVAPDNLTADAPVNTDEHQQLYEYSGGQLRFVCILPNGNPSTQSCAAGTAEDLNGEGPRQSSFHNAISADGSRVFWTESNTILFTATGRIYVRIGGVETKDVSKAAEGLSKASGARFWAAAADGAAAIFTIGDLVKGADLYEFEVDSKTTTPIAKGVVGLLGASEDASRVYLASREQLSGEEENSEGDKAQAGKPNLYLWERGTGSFTFIGTLADGEATQPGAGGPTPVNGRPSEHTARVSTDGSHAAFMSTATLTDYDNTDVASGKPDEEVYLYDAEEGELRCVSCNPSGARPSGRLLLAEDHEPFGVWAAAQIPRFESALRGSQVLSQDGGRLFFESYDPLVPRDTNGVQDVYEWEAEGTGSCEEADSTFNPDNGGCVELISSGKSPRDSAFLDASADGSDVFFATLSALLPQDYGLVDIYDARVGGGFPTPPPPPSECEGEACQGTPAPPEDPTPASSSFNGAGNVAEEKASRCAKGKARRKGRCTPKRHKHNQKRHKRRAVR